MGDYKGGVYRVVECVPTIIDLGELRVMGAPTSRAPRRERAEKLHLPPIRA